MFRTKLMPRLAVAVLLGSMLLLGAVAGPAPAKGFQRMVVLPGKHTLSGTGG